MLGHGAVTGEMHVYICVCDETCKYLGEIFFESFPSGLVLSGMLEQYLFMLLGISYVYGHKNYGIVDHLVASPMKYS